MTSSKFAATYCGGSLCLPLGLPLSRCSQFQSADPYLVPLRQTFHASLFQVKQRHASKLRISCNFQHRRGLDVGVYVGQLYNGGYLKQATLAPPSLKNNGQSRVSNPARRRLEVARSSGRFAASVIRGSIGKRRIRRSKEAGADEDDVSDDDQPYRTYEDAPISGSVHGDSFDLEEESDPLPTPLVDAEAETGVGELSRSTAVLDSVMHAERGGRAIPHAEERQGGGVMERSSGDILDGNRAVSSRPNKSMSEKLHVGQAARADSLRTTKKVKVEKQSKSGDRGGGGSIQDEGGSTGKLGEQVKKKGKKKAGVAEVAAEKKGKAAKAEPAGGKGKASGKKGVEKVPKLKKAKAPKLTRNNAFNERIVTEVAEQVVSQTGAQSSVLDDGSQNGVSSTAFEHGSQNGARLAVLKDGVESNTTASSDTGQGNGSTAKQAGGSRRIESLMEKRVRPQSSSSKAEEPEPAPDEHTSLLERLASSLHAGSSQSSSSDDVGRSGRSLHLAASFGGGRAAFVISAAAVGRLQALAEEEGPGGAGVLAGAAILEAATSLVESLVDTAQVKQVGGEVTDQIASAVGDVKDAVFESVSVAVEAVGSGVEGVTDAVTETVSHLGEQVMETVSHGVEEVTDSISETMTSLGAQMADTVDAASESVSTLVESVTDSVAETVDSVGQSLGDVGGAVVSFITEEEELGDTEFETFSNPSGTQFRGMAGLQNFRVLQDGNNPFHILYDAYVFSLKLPPAQFALVVIALPLLMSLIFTGFYLFDMQGLVPDESVQTVIAELQKSGPRGAARSYEVFQVFMFSLSLATGLQPVLAPVTPYSFVAANMNALLAQLLFVFLSGSVFARLSQRSRPIRCSTVALICPPCHNNRSGKEWTNRVLMVRYVLAGPKPSELVDVKLDLTFMYNTVTRSGSYFVRNVSLKLVRSEVAHQVGGMLVRHVIDESSPLYRRTEEMMRKEDAIFKLSVVGLERSSMQSVFELQHYCVADGDVIWDAEFEDVVLVNKSMQRVIDHSKLSRWRLVPTSPAAYKQSRV